MKDRDHDFLFTYGGDGDDIDEQVRLVLAACTQLTQNKQLLRTMRATVDLRVQLVVPFRKCRSEQLYILQCACTGSIKESINPANELLIEFAATPRYFRRSPAVKDDRCGTICPSSPILIIRSTTVCVQGS